MPVRASSSDRSPFARVARALAVDARLRALAAFVLIPGSCAPLLLLVASAWPRASSPARGTVTPAASAPSPSSTPEAGETTTRPDPICACAEREAPPAGDLDDLFPHLPQLSRALAEADRNCQLADRLARGEEPDEPGPYFRVLELEAALIDNVLIVRESHGELDAMYDECGWLARLEPGAPPGERTWEDVRFLLATIHWYLERARDAAWARMAPGVEPPAVGRRARAAHELDPAGRREFADERSFEDLLGRWD